MGELLINCRNKQTAEREIQPETLTLRQLDEQVRALQRQAELCREAALQRLKARAASDQDLADLLTVLGLV